MRLEAERQFELADAGGGLVVDFRAGGNAGEFRRTGWAEPEPRHTWTIGPESRLDLPRPAVSGSYRIVVDLGPFVWKQKLPVQRLTVVVDDCKVGDVFI